MTAQAGVVHLIDDDDGVRDALALLLRTSGFAVRVYPSATIFIELASTLQPGCIVTDVRMPGIDGLELQRQLTARRIELPVIVMTGHADVSLAVAAMKGGAVDFIEKPFKDELFLSVVKTALDRHMSNAQRGGDIAALQARIQGLTTREVEVLDGLVAGHPNKVIGFNLKISARTVEIHRANLMHKMQARSLSELVGMVLAVQAAARSPDAI